MDRCRHRCFNLIYLNREGEFEGERGEWGFSSAGAWPEREGFLFLDSKPCVFTAKVKQKRTEREAKREAVRDPFLG